MRTLTLGLLLALAGPAYADDGPERTSVDITVAAAMGVAMVDGDAVGAFGPIVAVGRGFSRFSVEGQYQLSGLADDGYQSDNSGWAHRLGIMGQYSIWGDKDASLLKDRFRGYVEAGGGRQWVELSNDTPLIARNHASIGTGLDIRGKFGKDRGFMIAIHLGVRLDVASQPGPSSGVDIATTMIFGSGISW
jgi:hypothetical protein